MALSGCGSEDGWTQQPPPAGFLRVVNTISQSPGFNVNFENQAIGFINFSESTPFTQVLPDVTRSLEVSFVRDRQLVVLISKDIRIGIDRLTTVIIAGTMSEPELLVVDDLPVDFPEGNTLAEMRFVHAASSVPSSVDYHLSAIDADSGSPLVNLSLNTFSGIIEVENSSESKLQTFVQGQSEPFWDSGSFPVPASSRPLLSLVDYFGPGDTTARMISIAVTGTSIFPNETLDSSNRFANMIPDVTSVDIYLDEELAAEDLLFGDIREFNLIDPGSYSVKVTTANSIEDVLAEGTITSLAGVFHTVLVSGLDADRAIFTTQDDFRRVSERATLAVSNSAPTSGSVDVYILLAGESVEDNLPAIPALTYPDHSFLRLPDGTYDIVFTDSGTNTIVLGPEILTFDPLGLYRIYLTDSAGGGEPLGIILGDDFDPPFSP
jgi:hypothetical protein